ncbi:hypothetical protein P8452_56510 [Trifolium repens]|nr:hypothetical protein P8452_56510 [Trifolium repens]
MATPQIRSSKTESYTDNKRKDDVPQFNIIASRSNQDLQGFVDLQMNTPKMRRHEPKTTSSSNSISTQQEHTIFK